MKMWSLYTGMYICAWDVLLPLLHSLECRRSNQSVWIRCLQMAFIFVPIVRRIPKANYKPKNHWPSPIPIDSPRGIPFRDFTDMMQKKHKVEQWDFFCVFDFLNISTRSTFQTTICFKIRRYGTTLYAIKSTQATTHLPRVALRLCLIDYASYLCRVKHPTNKLFVGSPITNI